MEAVVIREITKNDNHEISHLIRQTLVEFRVPRAGSAYDDPELDRMYETFSRQGSFYYVVEYKGAVIGGGGAAPLKEYQGDVCELQKMYLMNEYRGNGLGSELLKTCIEKARSLGYASCYLESVPSMKNARQLYLKTGFKLLTEPMGNTGHGVCSVWMILEL